MQLKTVFLALVVLLALFSCAAGKKHGKKKQGRSLLHKSEGHRKDKVLMKRHASPQDLNDGKSEKVVLSEKVDDSTGSLETNRISRDSSLPELSNSASQNNQRSKRSQASGSQKSQSSLPESSAPTSFGLKSNNLGPGESSAPTSFGLKSNNLGPDESSVPGIMDAPPSSESSSSGSYSDDTPTNGTAVPPNGLLDVGQIRAVSVSEICNGVLIDPQIVLTSASCVFPDYKSPEHENISFTLNAVTRKVVKVFANRDWRVDGQRKTNFALVRLDQPMTGTKASHPIELTWSPYALEDVGESFLAMPAPSSCQTASKKAQRTDEARNLNDDVITVDCHDRGTALAGSPMYRVVSGQPVIYGVHFGHCTTGALDLSTTGSCGARISKNVFRDFCRFASQETISLTGCESSTLLHLLTEDLPTTVYDKQTYAAIKSTATNPKGVVFVYYSSSSSKWADMVNDIEAIQRTKVVYDKFQVAIINVQALPYKVDAVPFIEYRTVGGKTYLPYTTDYDFKKFKEFMVSFSTVGAPPTESTTFLQHLNVAKRSSIERFDDGEFPNVQSSQIKNAIVIPESTKRQGLTCHDKAYLIKNEVPTERCQCLSGYFGSGTNCQNLTEAIETNCRFDVDATTLRTLAQIKEQVAASTWCQSQKFIVGYLNNDAADVDVAGDKLVAQDCVDEIRELIRCPKSSGFMADNSSEDNHNESYSLQRDRREVFSAEDMEFGLLDRPRRTVTSTATVPVPVDYLSSFLDHAPPTPTPYPSSNSYFIYQDWHAAAPNKYSSLYFGDRGIPEYTGYFLNHTDLVSLNGRTFRRKSVSNKFHVEPGVAHQGSDDFYKNGQPSTSVFNHLRTDRGHLNPSDINSYNKDNMRLTFTYTNAFPQYFGFNRGIWRKFESKIRTYAQTVCLGNDANSKFHLVTGLSDVQISTSTATGGYTPLRYPLADKWPSLASVPISSTLVPIVIPRSTWTVGCCTWTDSAGAHKAQSVSIWANNVHNLSPNTKVAVQPDLPTLAKELYPTAGPSCFKFFPANTECDKASNHYNLPTS